MLQSTSPLAIRFPLQRMGVKALSVQSSGSTPAAGSASVVIKSRRHTRAIPAERPVIAFRFMAITSFGRLYAFLESRVHRRTGSLIPSFVREQGQSPRLCRMVRTIGIVSGARRSSVASTHHRSSAPASRFADHGEHAGEHEPEGDPESEGVPVPHGGDHSLAAAEHQPQAGDNPERSDRFDEDAIPETDRKEPRNHHEGGGHEVVPAMLVVLPRCVHLGVDWLQPVREGVVQLARSSLPRWDCRYQASAPA
jgi:hypothetical protein